MKRNFVKVQKNNTEVKFQLDTGSDVILIIAQTWKKIGKPTLLKIQKNAHSIAENKMKFVGEFMGKTLKLWDSL